MTQPLRLILKRWIHRLRTRRSIQWTIIGTLAGAVFISVLSLIAFTTSSLLQEEYSRLAAAGMVLAIVTGSVAGLAWPIDELRAARQLDRQLHLRERMSTALEILSSASPSSLETRQILDAEVEAAKVEYRKRLPLRPPNWPFAILLPLLAANAVFWFNSSDTFDAALEQRRVRDTIETQAALIEDLIEEIRTDQDLDEVQKEQILEPLEEALVELEGSETLEDAFSALEKAQEQMRTLENPEAHALAEQLRQTGEALAEEVSEELEPVARELAAGDFQQAAENLREIQTGEMAQSEREELADALETLAEGLEGTDAELAEQLREAAEAARSGDSEAAEDALDQAAESLETLDQEMEVAQTAGEAADSLADSQSAVVQAGQPQDAGQTASAGGTEGGQTSQGGQGAAGGAGEGSGNSETQTGSEAGDAEIGQGNNPDGTGASAFQPISPSSIGGEGSDWVAIPPSGAAGENILGAGPSAPGSAGPLTVPYSEVFPQYQSAVNQAIDSGLIPPQYRDLIRDYFSLLEP